MAEIESFCVIVAILMDMGKVKINVKALISIFSCRAAVFIDILLDTKTYVLVMITMSVLIFGTPNNLHAVSVGGLNLNN